MENGILHVDMNNFYASVECLFAPQYRDVPMAVAGDQESRHGIILAKNMLAKQRGVKTAEPIWQARRKCPGLQILPPHRERYSEYSQKAKAIYCDYTDRVESFSLDECWLDVRGSGSLFGDGREIAEQIRARVKKELGLTVSIGVSFNKVFAKLGSDFKKPDAITVFGRENYRDTVWGLPARELLYVGPHTAKTLDKFGIATIGDLARTRPEAMQKMLGKMGDMLWIYANGLDDSPVQRADAAEDVKTIGNSTTLPRDVTTEAEIRKAFLSLAESVASRLRAHGLKCGEVQISVKNADFEEYQRQCRLESAACDSQTLYHAALSLYRKENRKWSVRGLGIRAGKLVAEGEEQCSLFANEDGRERLEKLETAMDGLRKKYGEGSVERALILKQPEQKGW